MSVSSIAAGKVQMPEPRKQVEHTTIAHQKLTAKPTEDVKTEQLAHKATARVDLTV